jgi:hypothetical protein
MILFYKLIFSTDSGSNYNVAKTTTYFLSYHNEADTQAALSYDPYGIDLAQGTGNNIFLCRNWK